jgi:hypothetical protein
MAQDAAAVELEPQQVGGLLTFVVEALSRRKGQWREISDAAEVPYDTTSKIARGVIPEPGVLKIERLEKVLRRLDEADATRADSKQLPLVLAPSR